MPRVIKVAPACAVMISTYEFGKTFFQKMNLDRERLASWRLSMLRVSQWRKHIQTLLWGQLGQSLLKQKLEEQPGLNLTLNILGCCYLQVFYLFFFLTVTPETMILPLNNNPDIEGHCGTIDFVCVTRWFYQVSFTRATGKGTFPWITHHISNLCVGSWKSQVQHHRSLSLCHRCLNTSLKNVIIDLCRTVVCLMEKKLSKDFTCISQRKMFSFLLEFNCMACPAPLGPSAS